MTGMVKLTVGKSPETGDGEYVMGGDGNRRGTGDSGLGAFAGIVICLAQPAIIPS
ncbi:MAG: hypothetical protein ACI8V0_001281 [Pseudohongiellaceae bacterium]|jgi:hypothetical protein